MAIDALAAAASAQDATKSSAARTKLAENLDTFLVMLTTQLKNQDPLSPMDSTEFTNQLVQFANVEQQINVNTNLETLITLQHSNQIAAAVNYIGRTVTADSNDLPLQDSKGVFHYNLSDDAKQAVITLSDSAGKVVHTIAGATGKGDHKITWDGKDASGKQYPDGPYTIAITAFGSGEEAVEVKTSVVGRVTGVNSEGGTFTFELGKTQIDMGAVYSVSEAATTPQP